MVGEVIEHYQILQRLGEGGMGTVYRALDTMLEREVALKLLRTDVSDQPDISQRFRAEAVALARLSHPHIATLFGLVRHGSQLCMVMELVRGETLAALLKLERGFPCDRAVRLAMQVLLALDYAHESGIVHRDVKPSNVIVAPSGVAKVLDFGIARVLDGDRMTRQGLIIGTPQYMAPEQIRGEEIDGRADVYAVGVMLYEMLAGRLPFAADSGIGLMYAHLEGSATPLAEVAPHVPGWLAELVHHTLGKSPGSRLTAAELRQALDEGLSGATPRTPLPLLAPGVPGGAAAGSAPSAGEHLTMLQPTVVRGRTPATAAAAPATATATAQANAPSTAPTDARAAATTPADLDPRLIRETEPYQMPDGRAAPVPGRTWALAAGVLLVAGLGAGALWLRQSAPDAAVGPAGPAAATVEPAAASPATATRPPGSANRPASVRPPASGAAGVRASAAAGTPPAPLPAPSTSAPSSDPAPPEAAPAPAGTAAAGADAPDPDREAPPPAAAPAATAAALPPASFDDQVLLVPADQGREEVEVRVTFHQERFVVFDFDAGRIVAQVFYRKPESRAGAVVLAGRPRLLTGSERWFILPTTTGELVLRLDLDASGDIVGAFEARSGVRVSRVKGQLGG